MDDKTRTLAIKKALLNKYRLDRGYLAFDEVSSYHLPGEKIRICDVLVQSLWGSMGHYRIGIEIKVSKQDLKKELNDFTKSNVWYKYVNKWFLAVPSLDIIEEDIPENWGILLCTHNVRIVKDAHLHEADTPIELFTTWSNRILKDYVERAEHLRQVAELQTDIDAKVARAVEEKVKTMHQYKDDADMQGKVKVLEEIFGHLEWNDLEELKVKAEKLKYIWGIGWDTIDKDCDTLANYAKKLTEHIENIKAAASAMTS